MIALIDKKANRLERKRKQTETDVHHRKPKCRGGTDTKENRVVVNKDRHIKFHALFGTMTPEEIAEDLNKFWIDSDYEMRAVFR